MSKGQDAKRDQRKNVQKLCKKKRTLNEIKKME